MSLYIQEFGGDGRSLLVSVKYCTLKLTITVHLEIVLIDACIYFASIVSYIISHFLMQFFFKYEPALDFFQIM